MTITLGSNINSLAAQNELTKSSSTLSQSYARLASGLRINNASDDAAGLAIADSLHANARIATQAVRNSNDALSALSIADGAYSTLTGIVTRISELAEQSANGVYSDKQRTAIDKEGQALRDEFNRIVATTSFNGINLLNGSAPLLAVQAGINGGANSRVGINLGSAATYLAPSGTFQAAVSLAALDNAIGLQTMDFNHDGRADIVATIQDNTQSVGIFLSNGDGTFQAPEYVDAGAQPDQAAIFADVNGDGILDILTDGGNDAGAISINLGNANGTFAARTTLNPGFAGSNGFGVGDVNGDGKLDIVMETNGLSVLLGNGNGTFNSPVTYAAPNIIFRGLADLNGDGKLDLISYGGSGTNTLVQLGNGNGTFGATATYISYPAATKIVDINGDGKLDIVNATWTTGGVQALINNGDGTFTVMPQANTGPVNGALDVADINGDGKLDIVSYSEAASNGVEISLGNGDGTFNPSISLPATPVSARRAVALGDFNGDGVLDVISTTDTDNFLKLFIQNSTAAGGLSPFSLSTASSARSALDQMQSVLTNLTSTRATLGAAESRIQTAISNETTAGDNFLAAESQIRDVDVAAESSQVTRETILQQAAASVLAQANLEPRLALKLLGN